MKKIINPLLATTILYASFPAYAGDLSLLRLHDNSANRSMKIMADEKTTDTQLQSLILEPKLAVSDDILKPAITFSNSRKIAGIDGLALNFEFTANAELKSDEATEMVNDFILDGGNLEFQFGVDYLVPKVEGLGVEFAYKYSLITSEELTVDQNVTDIDSEVQSINLKAQYIFNESVLFKVDYKKYRASNNDVASEFNNILDEDEALVFGLLMNLSANSKEYLLKFERARSSAVGDPTFRVVLETQI